ncbi:26S proteasome regulatory subunit rpn-1 like protein [Verticillium longisporum]|nr:26S proteasome regulatory subunit rpn-1 like protein [Verticillium longisporum]
MAALSCGLIFVGSSNPEVSEAIVTTLLDDERRDQLTSKWTRFMALGLGLLFFGRQEEVDVILETLKAVDHPMSKPTAVLAEICAWAGTGAVLKIQELLHICNEHMEEAEEKKGDELTQAYAVLGIALVAMGEDVGQEMVLRHFGHLMHYGEPNIRRAKQLGFLVARQRIMLELPDEIVGDDQELQDSLTNIKLSEHFKSLGKELNILEPKTTEDIYKSHLESSRVAGMTNLDSARHNLAAAFVNGFPESARLVGRYLRVLIFGGPAFVCFEGGKRFVQAQGLFQATTWVLVVVAPFNVFINWFLVWHMELGYIGAPIASTMTQNLLPLCLLLYVRFVDGRQCWGGFSRRAFSNWGAMLWLALPGMIMIQAEYMAFEVLTLFSSRFGASHLAAQSVLVTLTAISYQIPFPISIAASTRIANLIGAGLVDAAKTTGRVATLAALTSGVFNFVLFSSLRYHLPLLFTDDDEVVEIVAAVLPICAAMMVFDGLSTGAHGLLRGIGRPSVGGYAGISVYYLIALPVSLGTAFGLGWKLSGLWFGVTIGLLLVSVIEYTFVYLTDWHKAAREAERRNAAG